MLTYWNPKWQTVKDPEAKFDREMVVFPIRGDRISRVYGGKLVEHMTQATARDVLRDARVALCKAGHDIRLDVYDEFVELCREDEAEDRRKDMDRIMVSSSDWLDGCPLGTESKISKVYTK